MKKPLKNEIDILGLINKIQAQLIELNKKVDTLISRSLLKLLSPALQGGDTLLSDLEMPSIDGFTVLSHAKKSNPNIIAIVISGHSGDNIAKRVEGLGGYFMSKPVGLRALDDILKSFLKKQNLIS